MDIDELARLMPRTRAVNERGPVDFNRLQEYITGSQNDREVSLSQQSSVTIRDDIRKDAEGFEDIDDFWAEDDASADKDDTEGEESSLLSEGVLSNGRVSMLSDESDIQDESDHDQQHDETMELESHTSFRGAQRQVTKTLTKALLTPPKSKAKEVKKPVTERQPRVSTPERERDDAGSHSPDFGGDYDMSFGDSNYPPSPEKVSSREKPTISTPPRESKAASKKKLRNEPKDSFGDARGFDNAISPFSVNDAVLTPLSNASDKNLRSIEPFSEHGSANSPPIRVNLFKGKKSDDDWDRGNVTKRSKKTKPAASKKETTTKKDTDSSKTKKPRKYKFKSTPASDISFDEQHTDNDDGSFMDKSGFGSDDSDFGDLNASRATREGDLSHASEILKGLDDNSDGLRRSNRKRFKPLEWYKGEHYVYERRQSGVGLVIPTVRTIERLGSRSPQKKRRVEPKVKTASRSKNQKPFPRDELPKEFKYEDGEWAELWDTTIGNVNRMNVICRSNEIELKELPSEQGATSGFAGQSFNLRSSEPTAKWISGRLVLPPGAEKETESVGDAVQVFFVMGGQPKSIEVAMGPSQDDFFDPKNATRFLLNPNDEFYVPAKNAYYLKNHSKTSTCELHFMILKPATKSSRRASTDQQ